MKPISLILASLLLANVLQAQAPATGDKLPGVKLKIKGVEVQEQPTPMLEVSNVKMKRWTPKNWIELDVEFDIKLPEEAGGRKGTYAAMQLNIYVALQHMTKDGKREVITGTLDLVDIPADEPCHALAYISPSTLKSIFQKDFVTASSDIQGWGVEFIAEGKVIAAKSSVGNKPWWESKEAFSMLQGLLLNKLQTPFANVFGDYDVQVKAK
ncbi:MAG: hypothetical protein K9N47_18755 [Prosthecobacter sp.]|uniref:Amuc_1102 family pilus-like protein n=1 Tax=Prosthecobacter sp. TaxID=1965333 RepID=UPI0025E08442|nr:Amuc_1102 family pilus-like protein [Prosthecobacter sp.]MCF7788170.1 hypothetical protein [Prosthecobacter sp.]